MKQKKEAPLTDDELQMTLAALNSGDTIAVLESLKMLSGKVKLHRTDGKENQSRCIV